MKAKYVAADGVKRLAIVCTAAVAIFFTLATFIAGFGMDLGMGASVLAVGIFWTIATYSGIHAVAWVVDGFMKR